MSGELPHHVQPPPERMQVVFVRSILPRKPMANLLKEPIRKERDENIKQRIRSVRQGRGLASGEIEPERHVQHVDKPPTHCRRGFSNGLGIDLARNSNGRSWAARVRTH